MAIVVPAMLVACGPAREPAGETQLPMAPSELEFAGLVTDVRIEGTVSFGSRYAAGTRFCFDARGRVASLVAP